MMTTFPLKCKCGTQFRVSMEHAGQQVVCPGCAKVATAPRPKTPPPPPPVEEEVKLQPLDMVLEAEIVEEEDEDGGYGLDDNDGLANMLHAGPGMYGTVAVIRVEEQAHCLAFGSKGHWALAGQGDQVLMVDMKEKKKADYYTGHDAEVTSVALCSMQPLALSGDDDGGIRLWDVPTGKRRKKMSGHDGTVTALDISPDGKFAVSGGADGCIHLWDLVAGKRIEVDHGDWSDFDEEVTFVSFARDGAKFLAGGSEGRVMMWSTADGSRIKRYPGVELPISCVRLSQEGGTVTATTQPVDDGSYSYVAICHWDAKTGKPRNRLNFAVESVPCTIAPDLGGTRVVIAGDGPWMVAVRLADAWCMHAYDQLKGTPLCLAVSPLNTHVLAALDTERLQLFGIEAI